MSTKTIETTPKRALGRGLSALIPSISVPIAPKADAPPSQDGLLSLPLTKISLNPYQPREDIAPEQLAELAKSIRHYGVLQPIVVRPRPGGSYELIAGERRFRAATNLGLKEIPAVVREMDDKASLAIALIENLQREQLNPVESARAFRRLRDEFSLTQSELAQEVGKSQSTIANALRLLALPDPILDSLSRSEITEGHAKAILAADGEGARVALWREVVEKSLTVRETEQRAASRRSDPIPRGIKSPKSSASSAPDLETSRMENQLSQVLGAPAKIRYSGKERGQIEIGFFGLEELDGIIERLVRD